LLHLWDLITEDELESYVRARDLWLTVLWSLALCLAFFCLVFFVSLGFEPFKYYVLGNIGLFSFLIQLIGNLPSYAPIALGHLVLDLLPLTFALTLTSFWVFLFRVAPFSRQRHPRLYRFAVAQVGLTILVAAAAPFAFDSYRSLLWWLAWELVQLCAVIAYLRTEMPGPWRAAMTSHVVIALPLVAWGSTLLVADLAYVDHFVAAALVALDVYMVTHCAVASFYAKDNAARKGKLAESMSLGRTVQDFLLPANGVSMEDHLTYLFRYAPHGGEMSGDWLKHWRTDDGATHFLIGDVTGKGPQAALTVAMVMSVVSESILKQEDAGACMRSINHHLHRMFAGKIVTAAAAASVYPDGRALIYNAAALGWCVWNGGRFRHHLGRSSMLGLHPDIEPAPTCLTLHNGDHLMALTDGVASDPRSLRRLLSRLADELRTHSDLEALGEAALEHGISSAIVDDRALVAIKIGPTASRSDVAV
jgi:hypothetical protein